MDPAALVNSPQFQKSTSSSSAEKNILNRDDFMKLLLVQMRNQDPMNPMESYEFASQLAQFSSVEQLFNLNEKLDQNLEIQANLTQSIGNSLATTIVGKELRAFGNELSYQDGESSKIIFTLPQDAKKVTISIYDSSNTLIRTQEAGSYGSGTHFWKWDGKTNNGIEAPNGLYRFDVSAEDVKGVMIPLGIFMGGHITGVQFSSDGATSFMVGELKVNVADVIMINESEGNR